jgi:5-methylthioadenosine/S-adenosylhomocysteine deaminase
VQKVDYILCGDYIITMDEGKEFIRDGAVAINGSKIVDVDSYGKIIERYSSERIIRGKNRVLMPGFINTHTHAAMVYFRGLADDLPLREWLEDHIWPAENHWLSPGFISDAIELACLEMLKAGITTYNDMYFFGSSAALSTKKIGMRAVLGAGILDFPSASAKNTEEYLLNAENFSKEWLGDELIIPSIAPHAIYTCSTETFLKAKELAERLGILLHIHLSETEWEVNESLKRFGKRPVEYLNEIGFLDNNVLAAHCIWLDNKEIDILSKKGVGVSHCIESNLKLTSGIAPVTKMIDSNVKVSFGTDSAASNNDLNILSEISTAAKIHKAVSGNPTALDSRTVLKMATIWAAEALNLSDKIGSIKKGKLADIISINIKKPHLTPLYNVYSHIVYSAQASDVDLVMVNGRLIINDGRLLTADSDEILEKAVKWGEKIMLYNSAKR